MHHYLSLKELHNLEQNFVHETFSTNDSFEIKKGSIPVMVSAPHSVTQMRLGKEKQGEFRTGVISQVLHEATGCHCAFKTRNDRDDANFDEQNPYKEALIHHIKHTDIDYLLDLHIMSPEREHLVDIGTAKGRNISHDNSLVQDLIGFFKNNGIEKVEVDKKFTAGYKHTVSSTISRECGIPAIQIELNWRLLDAEDGIASFNRVIDILIEAIKRLSRQER